MSLYLFWRRLYDAMVNKLDLYCKHLGSRSNPFIYPFCSAADNKFKMECWQREEKIQQEGDVLNANQVGGAKHRDGRQNHDGKSPHGAVFLLVDTELEFGLFW